MSPNIKPIRLFARIASALGFVSISLTGEIATAWLVASWCTWGFSLISDLYPEIGIRIRRWETGAVAGMIGMLFIDFFILHNSVFIAITHFLLLFQMVKLAGQKTRKDCLQIFLFSFFQILAACTLSVDAWHAAVLLALIPTATAMLFWNQMESESERAQISINAPIYRQYKKMSALICAGALPLNLVLTVAVFVLFPRLTFNVSLPGFSGRRTGYTDQVNLAQQGSLQQDATVVLWLSFPRPEERAQWNGYLKGSILNQFDGKEWSETKPSRVRMITPDSNGIFLLRSPQPAESLLHQSITLANTSAGTLFVIGRPLRIHAPLPALQENESGALRWLAPWHRPLQYDVASEAFSETPARPTDLQLPSMPLEKIRALADKIAGDGTSATQAQNITQYLQSHYRYALSYGDRLTDNPVEDFLFNRREGLCGHFASAMVLMLRLRHIPSHIVAGYIKGEWNEPAQSVVIRERDAHAWVEVFIEGQGWVTFDPSPRMATAPTAHRQLLHALAQYWDYLDLLWNRFVIQYDLYAQIKAFENLKDTSGHVGNKVASWWSRIQNRFQSTDHSASTGHTNDTGASTHLPWKNIGLFLVLAIVTVLALDRKKESRDASTIRFYTAFLQCMARAGHPKAPHETGLEFARRLAALNPKYAELSHQVTEKYYRVRFQTLHLDLKRPINYNGSND